MLDVKQCLRECEEKMQMSAMYLEDTLSHIRAGKANVHILDAISLLWRLFSCLFPLVSECHPPGAPSSVLLYTLQRWPVCPR